MSVTTPAYQIPRWSVVGMEGMFTKMWDPPTESPATPDLINATNPVPEVLFAAGIANIAPVAPHTMQLDLLHGLALPTWDGLKTLNFFTLVNPDIPASLNGTYPGPTVRMPNGVIFHCATSGKGPPPHTIHWHGIEPTPMNDGVGHCSMEIGGYTYQWQPCFVGSYFYHCHRNTMQHFEFGLFGLLLIEPADAYFATLVDPSIPIGHCRDGKRRIGANLQNFPQFPDWQGGDRTDPDPWTGNPALKMQNLHPPTGNLNPHAQTVPYDVEALWVFDDRDSNWSDNAPDARTTFPAHGPHPGYDDNFTDRPGVNGFFAFNDYGADYWFVTGVPVPAHKGGTAAIPPGIVIPPELNSGISGSQVSVEGYVGQTILFRVLDAAYNNCTYTFPFDIVIFAWDGRPLGVPPYGFNEPYLVPANTPIEVSVGRRFDALARFASPVSTTVECKFIDTRGAHIPGFQVVNCTALVPVNISQLTVAAAPNLARPQPVGASISFTASMPGKPGSQAPTSGAFEYQFWLKDTSGVYSLVQPFSSAAVWNWATTGLPTGNYSIAVQIRAVGTNPVNGFSAETVLNYSITAAAPQTLDVTTQVNGTDVTFTATAGGTAAPCEYQFWLRDLAGAYTLVKPFSAANFWTWSTVAVPAGAYAVAVQTRAVGSNPPNGFNVEKVVPYTIGVTPATNLNIVQNPSTSVTPGTPISFTATASGGSGPYEYQFWLRDTGGVYTLAQPYSASNVWNWAGGLLVGEYKIAVQAKTTGSNQPNGFDVEKVVSAHIVPAPATAVGVVTQTVGTDVTFTGTASGGTAPYEYQFWLKDTSGFYTLVQPFSAANAWNWSILGLTAGTYFIAVQARSVGSNQPGGYDTETVVSYIVP